MIVIYKHSAQEAPLHRQHNGTCYSLSAAALWRNVACDEPGVYQAKLGWLWAEGTQAATPPWNVALLLTADSHPAGLGRGGLTRRLDLESCLFWHLFAV